MKILYTFFCVLFLNLSLQADSPSPKKIHTLYTTIDPQSIAQHLAFYQLYPETLEGKHSLKEAYQLLTGHTQSSQNEISFHSFTQLNITELVSLVNKRDNQDTCFIGEQELSLIEKIAARLPNRRLKGYYAKTENDVLKLPVEEIDLAHGLFLSQFHNESEASRKIRNYEAMIDLMALQILARLPKDAKPELKIRLMNDFIFDELGFRFPPHSLMLKILISILFFLLFWILEKVFA